MLSRCTSLAIGNAFPVEGLLGGIICQLVFGKRVSLRPAEFLALKAPCLKYDVPV